MSRLQPGIHQNSQVLLCEAAFQLCGCKPALMHRSLNECSQDVYQPLLPVFYHLQACYGHILSNHTSEK